MTQTTQISGLGRICSRCKSFTVIFPDVGKDGVHLLPVTGRFKYPCAECGWTLECDTRLLEFSAAKTPKNK